MALPPHTTALLDAKRRSRLSFADLGACLGQDEVWTASLLYGQATASADQAEALLEALQIPEPERPALMAALSTYPVKGALDPVISTDPLLYRFYEILQVYGLPLKDVTRSNSATASCRRSTSASRSPSRKTPRAIGWW